MMMGGFLVSRSLLSAGVFLFGVNALWNVHPRRWLQHKWWLIGLLWVAMYVLTYFWSADKHNWDIRWQVKLPILLLPLAFAFVPKFNTAQLRVFTVVTALMLLAGAGYSVSFLYGNMDYYIQQYHISHILPTPVKQDYIRFSLAIAVFIIWCIYIFPSLGNKAAKWFTGISIVLLAAYLHILASKSGLLALYLFMVAWGCYLIVARKRVVGLIVMGAIIGAFLFAAKYIPTFSERLSTIQINYFEFKRQDKTGIYGDLARLNSYDVAVRLIKAHPIAGVGTGDMLAEMNKGYDKWYPLIQGQYRLLPHDQFLVVALGCGIPAMLLFAVWVFMPLTWLRRNRESFFFFMVWLVLFIQLLVEPVLEVQFGVFVYLFFLLWQKETLQVPGFKTIAANKE